MSYHFDHTTYPIIFVAVLARQLCIPIPALLFLLSAGALAGSGRLNCIAAVVVSSFGCVLADLIWFELGPVRGRPVLRFLCALAPDPSSCMRKSRITFSDRDLRLLHIAKFVPGLDGICPPLAGILGVSRLEFALHYGLGAVLWSATYVGCGFFLSKELEKVARYTSAVAGTVMLALGAPLIVFFVWKVAQLFRVARLLRSQQIAPEQLKSRLDEGEKLGIIDLLRFEENEDGIAGIAGAVRLDPLELRCKRTLFVHESVELVRYCRSKNSFVSIRVATALRPHGVERVRVLQGGLAAWESRGLPVSLYLASPEAELARLGIEVYPPWQSLTEAPSPDKPDLLDGRAVS